MATNESFEMRMDEWALWCQRGRLTAAIGYPSCAPYMLEVLGKAGSKTPMDDRQAEVEACVMDLFVQDPMAAQVIRAEYRAGPEYGHPDYDFGNWSRERSCKQLGIKMPTYKQKLQIAKTVIKTMLYSRVRRAA